MGEVNPAISPVFVIVNKNQLEWCTDVWEDVFVVVIDDDDVTKEDRRIWPPRPPAAWLLTVTTMYITVEDVPS